MNILNKLTMLAVIALALGITACDTGLSRTELDFTTVYESRGLEKGFNAPTYNAPVYFPTISGNLTAGSIGTTAQTQVTLTFPSNIDVDALRVGTTLELLEAELKKFLTFNSLTKETVATNLTNGVLNTSLRSAITDWKVTRRDGRTVYIDLPVTQASSAVIETIVKSAAYTYNHGQKVDKDGNAVAGEAFYDDYYDYSIQVTNLATTSPAAKIPGDYVAYNNSPFTSVSPVVEYTSSWKGATLGFTSATDTTQAAEVQVTFPDKGNYIDDLKAIITVEKFNGTTWESIGTLSWERLANEVSYVAPVELAHTGVYQLVANNFKGLTTKTEINGGKRRIQLGTTLKKNKAILENPRKVVNTQLLNEFFPSKFWTGSPTVAYNAERKGVSITFNLDVNDNSVLGNQGLQAIPAIDVFNTMFKVGIPATGADGTNLSPTPSGDPQSLVFDPDERNTWGSINFIPITEAKLAYNAGYAATADAAPDRLVVYLNPEYKLPSSGGSDKLYIFINGEYKFLGDKAGTGGSPTKAGVFGDCGNIEPGELKGFAVYGGSTGIAIP
jgi:hypothetical protein